MSDERAGLSYCNYMKLTELLHVEKVRNNKCNINNNFRWKTGRNNRSSQSFWGRHVGGQHTHSAHPGGVSRARYRPDRAQGRAGLLSGGHVAFDTADGRQMDPANGKVQVHSQHDGQRSGSGAHDAAQRVPDHSLRVGERLLRHWCHRVSVVGVLVPGGLRFAGSASKDH